MSHQLSDLSPQTQLLRNGFTPTHEREHNEAIFATSSYVFESAEQAARLFSGEEQGNVYSRFTNPTVRNFEQRLALMEGGEFGLAFASGMAAITSMVLALLKSGDHVVASSSLFGSTVSLFTKVMSRFDIETTFVDLSDPQAWQQAVKSNTRLFYLESPSNPLCELADIQRIAEIAHTANALLAVDNAFCTPVLQQPLLLGADIVVHTATKYLDGQGRCVGGAVVTRHEQIYDDLFACLRSTGACMSPFNAWIFSKGLETLSLRMRAHCENAQQVAEALYQYRGINRVFYPGLPSHKQYDLACRTLKHPGGIVAFEVEGGRSAAWQLINQTRFLSITANLGDVKSTITHPASTTHARITQLERDQAGISDSLIRVSVGLEDANDIAQDILWGLG